MPVNVATNLLLSHANSSILPQRVMLQQNIPGGVGTFTTKITGYTPSNNYLLVLTVAGNPDREYCDPSIPCSASRGGFSGCAP